VTDAQLRFGLIGTGYWAREVHAAGIAAHPDARLAGVWGRDPAKTAATATSCDTTPFDELGALLETVDAVSFAVPPDVQAALTPQVVAAGCHVLFEKPLAIGLPAADAVLDAVQAAGVASVVFFTERFVPEREAWLTGLGECLGAEAHWLGSLQTPNNPFADSPWRKVEGALWDVGPHALAAVLPVLGPVRDILGASGAGDLVHLVLTHESGATSTLHLSLTMPPAAARSGLEFYRTRGRTRRWTPSRRTATPSAS
jgi:predicted dehydrogenase